MRVPKWRGFFSIAMVPIILIIGNEYLAWFGHVAFPVPEATPYARVAEARSIPMPVIRARRTYDLLGSAYNALVAQTDSTPYITASGARTEPGVVAVSRELRATFPYGSRVKVTEVRADPTRCLGTLEMLIELSPNKDAVFRVEDTMHPRKRNQIDFLMPTKAQADFWGRCDVTIVKVP